MKIELSCGRCGGNRFDYPMVLRDDAMINCVDCGYTVGTVAELQHKVIQQLSDHRWH
jgi:hypothetical protein